MNKIILIGAGVIVAVAAVALLVGGGAYKAPSGETPSSATPEAQEAGETDSGQVREITVEGDEYKFSPSTIELVAGEQVKINFKNTGSLPHNLMIDELGVATKTILGGKEDPVSFTAEKTGTFAFYCGVAGHRGLGMEGTTVVK